MLIAYFYYSTFKEYKVNKYVKNKEKINADVNIYIYVIKCFLQVLGMVHRCEII